MDRIISDKVGAQGWYERMPRTLPIAGFTLAMLATLAYAYTTERTEIRQRQQQARAAASVVGASLGRRVNAHTAYLQSAALLLEKSRDITQAEFIALSQELSRDDEYRGSEGISWAEAITPQQIPAFEAARRAEGIENYTVRPAPSPGARMLTPVTYLGDPTPRRRLSYGYDMYSEIQRRTAIDRAEREKRPIATGPIRLAMDRGRQAWPGFLIYMPLFDKGTGRMRGVLGAPFNAQVFLQSVIELEPVNDFSVALYDGAVRPDRLMARVGPQEGAQGQVRLPVMVAHRPMVLVVSPPSESGLSKVAVITLALGSVVACLLGGMAWLVARQAAEDRASLAWLREQASIRGMLSRELNHRVKNTLANVLSIIALTRRRGSDPTSPALNEFADALEGRIRALSATHDLLIASNWGTTPLREVVEAELAPYARGDTVLLEGPDVELAPNDALSLGLAVHELATNASKYGALSVEGARVSVRWALFGMDRVRVRWAESGGPPVPENRPRGFGTELIERILAHELGERFELVFAREGVRCEMLLPLRSPAMFKMRAKQGEGAGQL
ncbi:CHASE domain-containing protein [Novosphingobium sp. KACC 22771]|uniref:CHASE domain-containing protein n=1 Tax=Novosphingobium sp. KACC 22771 TaxID=3025670 RepID=UPI0023671202|nr:CHASE domain-containing protein [Novosphingobium sp. KACC 22771]WDF72329.1 CHASE domain-containing protein [Novosphingobium sp. KACC 22771]